MRQHQIPGSQYVNEIIPRQWQIPGGSYVNETSKVVTPVQVIVRQAVNRAANY